MSKRIHVFLYLLILLSCANKVKNVDEIPMDDVDNSLVTLSFSNKVNGYAVKAFWKPLDIVIDCIVGPAILEFQAARKGGTFYVTIDQFSIQKGKLPFRYSEEKMSIVGIDKKEYVLHYDKNKLASDLNFGTTKEPFFFQDINFDKQKELIIAEVGKGQRHYAAFKVYELDEMGSSPIDLSRQIPFNEIDETTKIDYELEQIIIHKSGGVCGNEIWTYFRSYFDEADKGIIKLGKVVKFIKDEQTGDCVEKVEMMTN